MKRSVNVSTIYLALLLMFGLAPNLSASITDITEDISSLNVFYGGAYATFAGKLGGEISTKEIERFHTLEVSGCAVGSRVFQYTLHVTRNGKTKKFSHNAPEFTKDMIDALCKLSSGDYFEFKSIKAHLPNGKDEVDVFGKRFVVT